MALKLMLIILSALSEFNSYSKANLVFNVPDHCLADPYNETPIVCSTAKVNIAWTSTTINIACGAESAVTDLKSTFSNMTINKRFGEVLIENCKLPEGQSFGELFKHFSIEQENTSFVGTNIGSSVNGRFSSGFEKLKRLYLSRNEIRSFNENVFEKMPELSELDLSHNKIQRLPENVLKNLNELKILDLRGNKLEFLSDGIFTNQTQLIELYIGRNALVNLTKDTFKGLASLEVLGLCDENKIKKLTDDVFHNIPNLDEICLGYDKLDIPYNIFGNNSKLKIVHLQRLNVTNGLNLTGLELLDMKNCELCSIIELSNITNVSITESTRFNLSSTLFKNLTVMRNLDLSSNKLTNLPDGLFHGLRKLTHLNISNNRLKNISGLLFGDLRSLIEIDLSGNHLTTIHSSAFAKTTKLIIINLTNNRLSTFSGNEFIHLDKLKTLNLSENNLTRMPSDLTKMEHLTELDLRLNQISSLKFSELRHSIDPSYTHTYLNDNPLKCDCSMYEFLRGMDQKAWAGVFSNNCSCDSEQPRKCHRESYGTCTCTYRSSGGEMLINCDSQELSTVPNVVFENVTSIELYISKNNLTELPNLQNNSLVTVIQASHNQISSIALTNLPSKLRVLDVSHNNIRTISADVVQHLQEHKSLEIFFFKENPLFCDCTKDTKDFIKFVNVNTSITDLQRAKCNISSTSSIELSIDVLNNNCSKENLIQRLSGLAILAILAGTFTVLFYKHQQFIKAWLYSHNVCLWWVDKENLDEEHLDEDKVFDAFISYSHLDEDFVHSLVTELENGKPCFKLCVHERDFLGGQTIEKSIIESVEKSRRTIVILSKNFLQSPWTKHEFHLAHQKSVEDQINRLIVVKYGDIGDLISSDSIIQSYVKVHTYLEADDNLWQRIRYALPHKKSKIVD